MKIQIKNYTFDASARTITFDDYAEIDIDSILWVVNVTDSKALYNPINKFLSGTVTGNVLTVDYDTTFMNDTDELQIYYDKIPDPATETKQDDIIAGLTNVLDNYKASDEENTEAYDYYGYLDKDGGWIIEQIDNVTLAHRYIKGDSDYTTNWTNRASLTYDYFNVIF